MADSSASDLSVSKDLHIPDKSTSNKDGHIPDQFQKLDKGAKLVTGTFSTAGGGSTTVKLLRGGFVAGQTLCVSSKNICLRGGVFSP